MPLEIISTLKHNPLIPIDIQFHIHYDHMMQIKKEIANIWE